MLTEQELHVLWREGESSRVEFKERLVREPIREAICAFANDLPGSGRTGVVMIGVRDNGDVAGLEVTDELLRTLTDMKTDGNILPLPSMTVGKRVLQGREIAVIAVEPSDSPPVKYKGQTFVRIGPRRGIATPQDERILIEKRRYGNRPFDLLPIHGTTLSDLDLSRFQTDYLPRAVAPEILEENDRDLPQQLASSKMIFSTDVVEATVLGLLVLGNNPSESLPGAYVQFLRIVGTEMADDVVDEEEIRGTVTEVISRLESKLQSHNRTTVDFATRVVERRSDAYPFSALQQIVRNAIMHRTYEESNAPVKVMWFSDRIEVSSPGGVYGAVTPENLGEGGVTDYRNPNLAEAMKVLGFVQRFGAGIPLARRALKIAGHPPLEFRAMPTYVIATVHRGDPIA